VLFNTAIAKYIKNRKWKPLHQIECTLVQLSWISLPKRGKSWKTKGRDLVQLALVAEQHFDHLDPLVVIRIYCTHLNTQSHNDRIITLVKYPLKHYQTWRLTNRWDEMHRGIDHSRANRPPRHNCHSYRDSQPVLASDFPSLFSLLRLPRQTQTELTLEFATNETKIHINNDATRLRSATF
jgi:hypothetical protein